VRAVGFLILRILTIGTLWFAGGMWLGLQYGTAVGRSSGMRAMFEMVQELRQVQQPPPPFERGHI
jgi:hypothetical protein